MENACFKLFNDYGVHLLGTSCNSDIQKRNLYRVGVYYDWIPSVCYHMVFNKRSTANSWCVYSYNDFVAYQVFKTRLYAEEEFDFHFSYTLDVLYYWTNGNGATVKQYVVNRSPVDFSASSEGDKYAGSPVSRSYARHKVSTTYPYGDNFYAWVKGKGCFGHAVCGPCCRCKFAQCGSYSVVTAVTTGEVLATALIAITMQAAD